MGVVNLRLKIENHRKECQVIDSNGRNKIAIGRHGGWNSVVIKDDSISQKHLLIEFKGGVWTLLDLQSSNGTIVNDVSLPPYTPHHLKNEDVIQIGEDSIIRVILEQPTLPTQIQSENKLQRMSLQMWFDEMEQWLPKYLFDASEQVIGQMREQSKRFDHFILGKDG